jgi:hypothetical protein
MFGPFERSAFAVGIGIMICLSACGNSGQGGRSSRDAGADTAAKDLGAILTLDSSPESFRDVGTDASRGFNEEVGVLQSDLAAPAPETQPDQTRDAWTNQVDLDLDTPQDLPHGGSTSDSALDVGSDDAIADVPLLALDVAQERGLLGSDALITGSVDAPSYDMAAGEAAVASPLDAGRDLRDAPVDAGNDVVVDAQASHDGRGGGHTCSAIAAVCGGTNVNLAISASNCGGCNQACPPTSVCSFGICEPGTSNWPTLQHDVQHTGENALELGQPPLCFAWSRQLDSSYGLSPPVVEDGRLFVASFGTFMRNAPLSALDVSDGSDLWRYVFADADTIGFPSVFSGSVYLANGQPLDTNGSADLWSFGAAAGSTQWVSPLAAQWEQYWAPIVVNGIVYTDAGEYGGLYGMAVTDGSQMFFQGLDQWDEWSPAFFNNKIYTFINGNFRKHDPGTGAVLSTVKIPFTWNGYSMQTAPVFGPNYAYVISPPSLIAIDTTAETIAWTANGTFTGTPALSGATVYGISNGTLQARDSSSGALLWTFVGDLALSYPPVVANGYVYVASPANVYAVSIATHGQVWTTAVGGWLAVAAHRLFVAGRNGLLSAYALSVP